MMMAGTNVRITCREATIELRAKSGSEREKILTGTGALPSRIVLTNRYRNKASSKS
jgi:hypothetical protein